MHFDGSKMLKGSGARVILTSPKGNKLKYVLQIQFTATMGHLAWPSMKPSFTGYAWPRRWASVGSSVMATLTLWSSRSVAPGMSPTPIWLSIIVPWTKLLVTIEASR
jgi:hypothetical protein